MTQDDGATPEQYGDDYTSGPYCRHWNDPFECYLPCSRCGAPCRFHDSDDNACNEFVED